MKRLLNLNEMVMVYAGDAGCLYCERLSEIKQAVLNNRVLREYYDEINNRAVLEDDEDILEEVLATLCSIKLTFKDGDMLYWDGKWTHEEVMHLITNAYT